MLVSTPPTPGRREASPAVGAASPPSPASRNRVAASTVLAARRVHPAVVALAGLTAGDGALQPRVTRPACPWRSDSSLVVQRWAGTTKSSTFSAE